MNIFLTVRQNQRFVGIDTLDDAEIRWSLEGQFDAFSLEDIQELNVFHSHFEVMYELFHATKNGEGVPFELSSGSRFSVCLTNG